MVKRSTTFIICILISLSVWAQQAPFNSSWESLENYECPEWFRDAKFGIWTCWNAYTVPAAGDWYARNMYIEGHRQYKYHLEHYGHPSEFGYKDIIPLWKGENFDPDQLVELFEEAGAKYIIALANHHDNFDLWDSKYHEWNSVNYGPKKDIIGLWKSAVEKSGLRWGLTTHLSRAWCWFQTSHGADKEGPYAGVPYDGNEPAYEDLYFETHGNTSYAFPVSTSDEWPREWYKRIQDLVDNYDPDLLYFDGGIPFGEIGREMIAYYYNDNISRHNGKLEAVMNIKNYGNKQVFHGDFRYGMAVEDVERGRLKSISQLPWQTDTSIGDWFWTSGDNYETPKNIIDQLVDIVSKNGNLLLNVPPRADGTLDDDAITLLKEIGSWLKVNGEGIYGTRPYTFFGDGPTDAGGGHFSKMTQLTTEDFRYTTKGDTVFAFVCGEPSGNIRLEAFSGVSYHRVKSVEMLGISQPLEFSQEEDALVVSPPATLPCKYTVCLRIIPNLNPAPAALSSCDKEILSTVNFFVSTDGEPGNPGTKSSPTSFASAILKAQKVLTNQGLPEGGISILIREGHYPFNSSITLGEEFIGTASNPIVIRSYPGEKVIFDGSFPISPEGFSGIKSAKEISRLAASAKEHILVKTITDPDLIKKFSSKVIMSLSWGEGIYLPSRYPNEGFAVLKEEADIAELCPPGVPVHKGGLRAGSPPNQEPGKPRGWRGTMEEPRGAYVGIDFRESEMAGTWKQWEKELKRDNTRHEIRGFLDAYWLLGTHHMVSANSKKMNMHLSRVMAYGWDSVDEKEFRVFGLIGELDQAGEWYFDVMSNKLYVYPPEAITEHTSIGLPYANGFLHLEHTQNVSIIGIEVQNVGEGTAINIQSGKHNLIAGCRISNSTAQGISISGEYNGVISCDLVDLNHHVELKGGLRSPHEISPGHNYVKNCHFYQKNFFHEKIGISMSGVGNIFSNNLVHNSLGQPMTVRGNDHLLEMNEFFNVGYEEGDGGAIYSGADLTGYGTVYQYNFFHHLMHVPGKVARAAIHLDDHQAGATCIGNVFYKSAEKGVFSNHGSGHVIRQNVCLEGALGVYIDAHSSRMSYERQVAITADPNHPSKLNKEDYVGKAERVVGPQGWNNEPWKTRYPRFNLVMNDTGEFGRMWTIRNIVEDNFYYGNVRPASEPQEFGLLHGCFGDTTVLSRCDPAASAKCIIQNDIQVNPTFFRNYEKMDFSFIPEDKSLPKIPFESMGLYEDEFRTRVPDKAIYRNAVKDFFDGIPSYPGTKKHINTAITVETSIPKKLKRTLL